MTHSANEPYWRDLESNAHRPEVQEQIREEIRSGTIRVRPNGEGAICIMPVFVSDSEEPIEVELPSAPLQDETSATKRGALRSRMARR
jgi:hypothetical protein